MGFTNNDNDKQLLRKFFIMFSFIDAIIFFCTKNAQLKAVISYFRG